jgi:hypothetical protein
MIGCKIEKVLTGFGGIGYRLMKTLNELRQTSCGAVGGKKEQAVETACDKCIIFNLNVGSM